MSRFFELFDAIDGGRRRLSAPGGSRQPVFTLTGECRAQIESTVAQLYLQAAAPAPRVLAILGVEPATRSRWVCAHVADLLASQRAASVCLVEADPVAPSLNGPLGLSTPRGLTHLITDAKLDLNQAVVQVPNSDLWLLTFGSSAPNGELSHSGPLRDRLNQMRLRFDFVLIDAPSVESGPNAWLLPSLADGAVLVLETGTRRPRALHVKEELEAAGVELLGVAMIDHPPTIPRATLKR
jgi:Mrp family chromosome partitioning ATPase